MIEYRIEDDFDIDVDGYWDMFFSEGYATRLWPAIDIQYELVELERKGEGKDETIHRIQKLTPIRDIPAVLKKVVSGAIAYTEHNEFSRAKSEMTTKTVPSFLAEKLDTQGVYSVVPAGEGRCKRIWQAHCKCTIPLLGKKVEQQIVGEVKESYRRATDFTRKYLTELAKG